MSESENRGQIIVYNNGDKPSVKVTLQDETIWLTQRQMAELFDCSTDNISLHLKNIFESEELDKNSVTEKISVTANDGKNYLTQVYNLDAIIAVGYRVNSKLATAFRQWATKILREYIVKGFVLDDERLKNGGNPSKNYFKELLERIKDIRSSEKVLYRQVLDLYATSIDYNPKSETSREFFKVVQNKLHFAAHGHTAAEVIFDRADSQRDFMGLQTFKGDFPVLADVTTAKNYLDSKELKALNNLVSAYFDLAELKAESSETMTMREHIEHLDSILRGAGREVLENAGRISAQRAKEKAIAEYRKFQVKALSPVEKEYLESIREMEITAKKASRTIETKAKQESKKKDKDLER